MIATEDVPVPSEWIDSMLADARAELAVAETLYKSAMQETRDDISDDLDKIASLYRDVIAIIEGENQRDLAAAESAYNSVVQRLKVANQRDIETAYNSVAELGGSPPYLMPYVNAALDRGIGAQDAIDHLYAPRGSLTDMAAPLDPFSLTATAGGTTITATARVDLAGLIPAPAACPTAGVSALETQPISTTLPVGSSPPPPPPPPPPLELTLVPAPVTPPPPAGGSILGSPVASRAIADVLASLPDTPMTPLQFAQQFMDRFGLGTPVPPAGYVVPRAKGRWADADHCVQLSQETAALEGGGNVGVVLDALLHSVGESLSTQIEPIASLGRAIMGASDGFTTIVNAVADWTGLDSVDNGAVVGNVMPPLIAGAWAERLTGGPYAYLTQGLTYDLQWAAPQYIPSQGEVDAMYVAGYIGEGGWDCWTRANGNITTLRKPLLETQYRKPDVDQEVLLENRGFNAPAETEQRLKNLGVNADRNLAAFRELAKFVAGPSDLVRFMVRDSFDPLAVLSQGYDKDFEAKFLNSPDALRIAKANGITVEDMRLFWRAHWETPSYTQISEGLHRLRPGRAPEGVEPVTLDVAKNTLEIDDMAPAWVSRLLALSYNVITKTDVMTWFVNGTIDGNESRERLQDCGYTLNDSIRIVEAWEWDKINRRETRDHGWTRSKVINEYIGGAISRKQALQLLDALNPDPQESIDALANADSLRRVQSNNKCIQSLKIRYFRGEFGEPGIIAALSNMGLDREQYTPIVQGWTCEMVSGQKQPTLLLLRKWYHRGIIDADNLLGRLINLRYTEADASKIVREMNLTEQDLIAKRLESQAKLAADEKKREQAERTKEEKAAEAKAEKIAAKEEKAAKAAQAALDKAERARVKLLTAEEKAAEKAAAREAAQRKAEEKQQEKAEKIQAKISKIEASGAATTPPATTSGAAQPDASTGTSP